jgi:hypothetical protein
MFSRIGVNKVKHMWNKAAKRGSDDASGIEVKRDTYDKQPKVYKGVWTNH